MKKNKKSQKEETRDEVKSFLTKPELIDSLIEQIFKVLDMEKTGTFTKEHLLMYLGFFCDECGLNKINENALDKILIKRIGLKDSFKLNPKHLDQVIRIILEDQLETLNNELKHIK